MNWSQHVTLYFLKKILIFINLYLPITDTLSTMAIFCSQGLERFDCIKITEIDLSLSLALR